MPEFTITESDGVKWAVPAFGEGDLSSLEREMLEFLRERNPTEGEKLGINWPRVEHSPISLRELIRMELSLAFGDLLPEDFEVRKTDNRVEYKFDQLVYESHARI